MKNALALLAAMALPAAALASPIGEWSTDGGKARVRIESCAADAQKLCGTITWSYRPEGVPPGPLVDVNNQDPALRTRPIVGLPLLQGFVPDGPDAWAGGTIYDPEGGKTYKSKLRLKGQDTLEVDGCILFLCRGQTWTRWRG
jgi:uncharacterized protein (DUF2147 family)